MIRKTAISTLVILGSIVFFRGGFQKIPFSSSNAFFSQNNTDNFAAVNKFRFLIDSYEKARSIKKHIPSSPISKAINLRSKINGPSFLKSGRPNILLIILEGIPSVVLDTAYNSTIKIPYLRNIKTKSYSYENVFSSGFRTDQGITSLFSGIPAYPYINVLKDVDEINSQPTILQSLNDVGYHTSFHYGGDSQFSSMKKFLLNQKIDFLMDQDFFYSKDKIMDWGVPDHVLFQATSRHLMTIETPFFSTILTSSTHLPFDYPGNDYKSKNKKENFIGSLEYLDQSLGVLLDTLTRTLQNTLFIITSDHGCLYLEHDFNDHNRFKVPFLVFGDAVKDHLIGSSNQRHFNSHDFPLTINNMLNLPPVDYPLSCDMTTLDSNTSAYWITEHTMGWSTANQSIVTNHDCSKSYFITNSNQSSEKESQSLCEYFNSTITHLHKILK